MFIPNPPSQDESYLPARGTVLLLSCMDPRLLDDTVLFMNHDNLCNRYDHVVMAGAALGALGGCLDDHEHWRRTFFDHLAGAVKLHGIEEVYIVEHRNCGAYHKIFQVAPEFGDSQKEQDAEEECHLKHTQELSRRIDAWAKDHGVKIRVKSFLMDLRGHVTILAKRTKKSAEKKVIVPRRR